jgi:HlyD family secretion protein
MTKWIIIVLLIAVSGGGAYFFWMNGKEKIPEFRMAKVAKGQVMSSVSASGVVKPINLVAVGSQVSGTIKKLHVDFNDKVKQGQILCELDRVPLEARVAQDRASLKKAEARIDVVKTNLALARKELNRAEQLAKEKLISDAELDKVRAQHDVLEAEAKLAQADVEQTKAALQMSEANLGYATIYAPCDGVVVSRNVNQGQTVAASLQAPTLFEIAESLQKVHVLGDVSEADIGQIKDDQKVSFTVDAHPDARFFGKVLQIRLSPKNIQNVVTYTVVVEARNQEGQLLPGMTANMRFIIDTSPGDALKVPNMALRFEPEAAWVMKMENQEKGSVPEEQKHFVYVIENGKLKGIPVKIGITDGRFTHILEGEISEDQQVVIGIKREGQSTEELRSPFQQQWRGPRGPR